MQRTPRKKILDNLCDLRVLCGEILLENGIGFPEVSYKVWGFSGKMVTEHCSRNFVPKFVRRFSLNR
jgi:hypothetical protein